MHLSIPKRISTIWSANADNPQPSLYLSIAHLIVAVVVILVLARAPPSGAVFWPVYGVLVFLILLASISFGIWHQRLLLAKVNSLHLKRFSRLNPTAPSSKWTPNERSTLWTASITTLVMPLIFYFLWKPGLVSEVMNIKVADVPSVYYPSMAILQNVHWSSQAQITLQSQPKCFVGWMEDGLPACDAVANAGDWCNCTNKWDEAIVPFQWQNMTYNMLSWNPDKCMIDVKPTVPLLTQAFFTCKLFVDCIVKTPVSEASKYELVDSAKSFGDSFSHSSPSLWLAIWDGDLSLQDSLAYGYTRLQLIDALATISINLALNYRIEPGKAPAYDYALTTLSTIPSTGMMCDTSSDENYGPCFVTILLHYPSFRRTVTTIEAEMQWKEVAEALGAWYSLFQIIGWVLSGLAMAP